MPNFDLEKYYALQFNTSYKLAIGVDEVGRGPLAGPVVACSCMIKHNVEFNLLLQIKDSKKLSYFKRIQIQNQLFPYVDYAIGVVDVNTIDNINILQASLLAMQKSYKNLILKATLKPTFILLDGNQNIIVDIPSIPIVKGDNKSYCIALASILAKNYRDNLMIELSKDYPQYEWNKNMGYGTKSHLDAIKKYGITKHHRQTFAPIKFLV